MNRPTKPQCQRVYRMIQAHCSIRISTQVGAKLRSVVGANGDIGGLPAETLRTMFTCPVRQQEAMRLAELARMNTRKVRRNGQGETKNGEDCLPND